MRTTWDVFFTIPDVLLEKLDAVSGIELAFLHDFMSGKKAARFAISGGTLDLIKP